MCLCLCICVCVSVFTSVCLSFQVTIGTTTFNISLPSSMRGTQTLQELVTIGNTELSFEPSFRGKRCVVLTNPSNVKSISHVAVSLLVHHCQKWQYIRIRSCRMLFDHFWSSSTNNYLFTTRVNYLLTTSFLTLWENAFLQIFTAAIPQRK